MNGAGGELHRWPATALAAALRTGEVSAVEVLEAHLAQIGRVNGAVNAIVTLDEDGAAAQARDADALLRAGAAPGPLHGMPIAVKDLEDTAGMRTTYGSPLYADHVPQRDSPMVERLRAAGAIVVGKTNTPEFGAGSQTFNEVFGVTRNPYDLRRTAGGSSGGAAAAVAARMLPFADGSDLAASVRNPAAFCNVVGLRPSPGRWPDLVTRGDAWDPMSVLGPIARSVDDVSLLYHALTGRDDRYPISLPGGHAAAPAAATRDRIRVAWTDDLGDLPVDPEITEVLAPHRETMRSMGWEVVDAAPGLAIADEAFDVLRAVAFAAAFGDLVERQSGRIKDTVRWNAERAAQLTARDVARAQTLRTRSYHRMRGFLGSYDVLALPVSQVAPFPAEVQWVRAIGDHVMPHYVAWLRSCSRITVTAHPAISVPAGFTSAGLPVGLQLVGRYRDEDGLLRIARAFEAATGFAQTEPDIAPRRGP
ncbi:MAG: amidase [Actinobacteria bacterium]|nr:amidase [Actinomycetota bacterium]